MFDDPVIHRGLLLPPVDWTEPADGAITPHEVARLDHWAVVLLPDAIVWRTPWLMHVRCLRTPGAATVAAIARHNKEGKKR